MTRSAADIGAGLAAARAPRPIRAGERIHIIGAAGAGASAATWLAWRTGAVVSGCDPGGSSPYTAAIEAAGIPLVDRHAATHVIDAGQVLVDRIAATKALTSVAPDHPELVAARAAGVVPEPWQQVIADVAATHGGRLVGVAGTHGKSTVSGWLVHLLVGAGADPAAFVGALMPAAITGGPPSTARWGMGDAFVVEADEYAGNFDPYRPDVTLLLNAEWDHPDVFADESAVLDAFEMWLRAPGASTRTLVANVGDPGVGRLMGRLADWPGRVVRVALDGSDTLTPDLDMAGQLSADGDLKLAGPTAPSTFAATRLALAGRHNAANALCVAAAAMVLGIPPSAIADGLATFRGVGRRMESKGEPAGVLVLDDYGHHPTAIAATLSAVRGTHPGRSDLGRLRAAHLPPHGSHAGCIRGRAGDRGPGGHRGHLGGPRPGHDHHQCRGARGGHQSTFGGGRGGARIGRGNGGLPGPRGSTRGCGPGHGRWSVLRHRGPARGCTRLQGCGRPRLVA